MFTKQKCTDKLSLQNKTKVQTNYVYKTKYKTKVYKHVMSAKQNQSTNTLCLQNKTKVYIQVMFTNKIKVFIQVMFIKHVMFTKQKFTNTFCLQNKQFTEKLCLQNKTMQNRKFTNTLYL